MGQIAITQSSLKELNLSYPRDYLYDQLIYEVYS